MTQSTPNPQPVGGNTPKLCEHGEDMCAVCDWPDDNGNDALRALVRLWTYGLPLRCKCEKECESYRNTMAGHIPVSSCTKGEFSRMMREAEAVLPADWPDEWDIYDPDHPGRQAEGSAE